MSIIGIVSMKGGVGKTSITANLASALSAKLGTGRVCTVDLDPQNGLHWHFGMDSAHDGLCERSLEAGNWGTLVKVGEQGVGVLPYGAAGEPEREAFEALLAQEADWVGDQIRNAALGVDAVVLIDTPPGPSVYLKQVFACAELILVVLLPDAASYATIPSMESWMAEMDEHYPQFRSVYVLNQIDRSDALNRDVAEVLHQHLGTRLAPVAIHADEAVCEALAFQQPVLAYDPHGQASHDFARLAAWLIDTLNQ